MGEIILHEVARQEYSDGRKYIASGLVEGHEVDVIYLEFGGGPTIYLRADEAASIVWALGGALYSLEVDRLSG